MNHSRQFNINFPFPRPIIEHRMVKLEQAALHPVISFELQESESFALFRIVFVGDESDGGRLDGGKVFLEGGFGGCEREVTY